MNIIKPNEVLDSLAGTYYEITDKVNNIVIETVFKQEPEEDSQQAQYQTRQVSVNTIYATIFRSNFSRNPSLIAATERHPFLTIPIGLDDEEGGPVIQGLLDTGAGLSIGYYNYWEDFADKFPQHVKTFEPIDFSSFEKICVGGVNCDATATTCTHFIEIYTPLRENGRQVTLRIGLAKDFSANLIFGLPFFVRARMIIHIAEGFVFSQTFQKTFQLQFLTPMRRKTVPTQGEGMIQTFISGTKLEPKNAVQK